MTHPSQSQVFYTILYSLTLNSVQTYFCIYINFCHILSSGDKLPGIYSRLSPSVDWIKETSSGEFCAEPPSETAILPRVTEERSTEEPNPECGTLLKRYPDIALAYLKCRKSKRNRDWEWINSHLDLCTRSMEGFRNRFYKYL